MTQDSGINNHWSGSKSGRVITLPKRHLFDRSSRFFLIGSCFAMEIKNYLTEEGVAALPNFSRLAFDPRMQNLEKLRSYNHTNHFDTFSMRQEFELAFGERKRRIIDCMPTSAHDAVNLFRDSVAVEDCYRPYTYANSPESLFEIASRIDDIYRSSIIDADVVVCTFGLTEVWRRPNTELVSSVFQRSSTFYSSTYEDNLANIRRIVELVRHYLPKAVVVFTVSPVPLLQTGTAHDVVVANTESKSILRTAVGTVCRDDNEIVYFPSYEIAMYHEIFDGDGRHVKKEWTRRIFKQFAKAYGGESFILTPLESGASAPPP